MIQGLTAVTVMPTNAKAQNCPPRPALEWGPVAAGYDIPIPPVPSPRMEPGEPVPTPQQAADIISIQRLQMAYGQLHEHGTADEIAALFHADAEIYCLYLGSKGFKGRTQIRNWYAWWLQKYEELGEYYRHRPFNQVIDLDGDRAFSHSILMAEGCPRDTMNWDCCMGRYVHEVVREGDGWFFRRSWNILHAAWKWPDRRKIELGPPPFPALGMVANRLTAAPAAKLGHPHANELPPSPWGC